MKWWTPRRDQILRKMRADGATFATIAERLGVSRDMAAKRAQRLGIVKERARLWAWGGGEIARCLALRRSGLTAKEIASALGRSQSAIEKRLRLLRAEGKLKRITRIYNHVRRT